PEPELTAPEPEPELTAPEISSVDPFDGIKDEDITTFSDLFDVPLPENDNDAFKLGNKIRQWIKDGRLEPGQSKDEDEDEIKEEIHKQDKEEKPKKKRGMFGFFKK
ncbi:MAG: signal recognition particle-docking protein FtsY, partial [Nitrosopumilus sp.]